MSKRRKKDVKNLRDVNNSIRKERDPTKEENCRDMREENEIGRNSRAHQGNALIVGIKRNVFIHEYKRGKIKKEFFN